MAQWKARVLRRADVERRSPAYLVLRDKHAHIFVCAHALFEGVPAIELRGIGQGKLIPSALNCLVSQSVNWRDFGAQIPFALPSLWQVHSSPSRIMTEELDVASLM